MSSTDEKSPTESPEQNAAERMLAAIEIYSTDETPENRTVSDTEHQAMEAYYNMLVENMQKRNPRFERVREDFGPPPNLDKNPNYGIFAARKKSSETQTANIHLAASVLWRIGDHVGAIQETIAASRDGSNVKTTLERRVAALAKYIGGLQATEVAVNQIEDSDKKEDKCVVPPLKNNEEGRCEWKWKRSTLTEH